jgi:hypothetical protein
MLTIAPSGEKPLSWIPLIDVTPQPSPHSRTFERCNILSRKATTNVVSLLAVSEKSFCQNGSFKTKEQGQGGIMYSRPACRRFSGPDNFIEAIFKPVGPCIRCYAD